MLVDGAQAAVHLDVDVQNIDCDFYACTGHKIYGPTGIGVLYGKYAHLDAMPVPATGMPLLDFVKLPMLWHAASGRMLLHQVPVTTYGTSYGAWPGAEFWAFDVEAAASTKLPVTGQAPAAHRDDEPTIAIATMVVWGGAAATGTWTART